jgi:AcrR family transcriptional regulator
MSARIPIDVSDRFAEVSRVAISAPVESARRSRASEVLEEAARALNSRGVSQTSLTEIADRLGVSRAALYYYFEDQEDLVFKSYRRSCEAMADQLDRARRNADALRVVEAFVDGMLAEDQPEFAVLSEVAYLGAERRRAITSLHVGVLTALAAILEQGANRGEVRRCDSVVVGQAIIGLVSWALLAPRWRAGARLSRRDLRAAIRQLLDGGVAADRSVADGGARFDLSHREAPLDRVFDPEALAAAKQEALLASASWLFNLKGVDATSLEEIALRVGVTKRVIYHNVGDKETLVGACFRRSFRFHESVAERMERTETSRLDAFCATTRANAEASLREDIAPLAPLANLEALPQAVREEIQAAGQRLMRRYLRTFKAGQAEGSIRKLPARAVLAAHPGVFQWLPKWFDTLTEPQRLSAPDELADLTRLGLRPL